jgi:oxalate decarboxylase/phosphoglucose isomerase-like protein (cupin superfamily)
MTAIDPHGLPTQTFEWGTIKWFVAPAHTPGAAMSFGEVVLLPGLGHDRHNHPDSEEILYVLSGEGEQMLADGDPFPVGPGDTIYVPLRLLAIYNPGGPERALEDLPDFREVPAGRPPSLRRA